MFLRVISILFLVLYAFHFSTVQVICNSYGHGNVKLMHKFERVDFRYQKILLDLGCLDNCIRNDVVPKLVQFLVGNKDLRNWSTYRQCQTKLLIQQNYDKKRRSRLLKKGLLSEINDLMYKLKWIDFNHVCNLFFEATIKLFENNKNSRI